MDARAVTRSDQDIEWSSSSASQSGADGALRESEQVCERRSFFRACSRKSIESNPEDVELFVGEDGLISSVAMDDRTRIERLKHLLEKKEKDTRQAAEYGLGLLESNRELQLQVSALKIQLEADTAELTAERDLYKRRHENAVLDIDNWKRKCSRLEEEKYELEGMLDQCACRHKGDHSRSQTALEQRIADLEATLEELQTQKECDASTIAVLTKWKASLESEQKGKAVMDTAEATSERIYTAKLEGEQVRLRQQLSQSTTEQARITAALSECDGTIKRLKKEIDRLQDELAAKRVESNEQAELLHTSESKCSRLQRELALMEHVSYLSMAVIDHDDDEDDDEDDDDAMPPNDNTPTVHRSGSNQEMIGVGPTARTSPRPYLNQRRSSLMTPAFFPFSTNDGPVPATPSSMATHQKLHHYFHLTAVSIIHENDLHELIFNSSSRGTIDTWYQEILDQGVPFLEWHSWLINRISIVAASIQGAATTPSKAKAKRTSTSSTVSSPFLAFARRRESTLADRSPSLGMAGSTSPHTPPTPRVPFSVAKTFFRLLGRRDSNQTELEHS